MTLLSFPIEIAALYPDIANGITLFDSEQTVRVGAITFATHRHKTSFGMNHMGPSYAILLCGRDHQLLRTRSLVLEHVAARVWTTSNAADIPNLAPGEPMDLIILCHSLAHEECVQALELARERWPDIQSLQLVSDFCNWRFDYANEVADPSVGPAHLLQTVAKIVDGKHKTNSHPA